MQRELYLDNAATTPVHPEVAQAIHHSLVVAYGNPSSLHRKGMEAEGIVKEARSLVAEMLGVSPAEVYFTSGGTEANALAIKGVARARQRRGKHLITTQIEHSSVLAACRDLEAEGFKVTYLPVDAEGRVDPEEAAAAVTGETILLSVMHVNNEIGTIQPIGEIVEAVRGKKEDILVHVDGVQAFGKIPVAPEELGVDLLSVSAHKLHGPKGIGALYCRKGVQLQPLFGRGTQERGLRSGTENVPGIAGLGAAIKVWQREGRPRQKELYQLKEQLIEGLLSIEGARLNGARGEGAAPHIVNLSFPGVRGEVLVHALEEKGLYVSTGSACSSRKAEVSHVLKALGLAERESESSIRISLSYTTTAEEIAQAVEIIQEAVSSLRKILL